MDPKGGEFKTLMDAIKSVPAANTKRVIIKIAPGEYREKVTIDRNKPFITLMGDPKAMPVITFDGTAAKYGTVDSASLIILSDYFMAVNIVVKVYFYYNFMLMVLVKNCIFQSTNAYIDFFAYLEYSAGTGW